MISIVDEFSINCSCKTKHLVLLISIVSLATGRVYVGL